MLSVFMELSCATTTNPYTLKSTAESNLIGHHDEKSSRLAAITKSISAMVLFIDVNQVAPDGSIDHCREINIPQSKTKLTKARENANLALLTIWFDFI